MLVVFFLCASVGSGLIKFLPFLELGDGGGSGLRDAGLRICASSSVVDGKERMGKEIEKSAWRVGDVRSGIGER